MSQNVVRGDFTGRNFDVSEETDQNSPLQIGGGGSNSGGMSTLEIRVTNLEGHMKVVRDTLGRMEPVLARIDEKLNHTATKQELTAVEAELIGRVSKVEAELVGRVSKIEGIVSQLPSTWMVWLAVLATPTLLIGMVKVAKWLELI